MRAFLCYSVEPLKIYPFYPIFLDVVLCVNLILFCMYVCIYVIMLNHNCYFYTKKKKKKKKVSRQSRDNLQLC